MSKVLEKIINIKLPIEIEKILIKNPPIKPKKNPEPTSIIIPPGNDKIKKQMERIKYKQNA